MESGPQSSNRPNWFVQAFFVVWICVVCTGYLILQAPYTVEAIVTQFPALSFLLDARGSVAPWFAAEYKK